MCKLAIAALFGVSIQGYALEKVDSVYQITNAEDFLAFSDLVAGGENNASAILTADIDFSGVTDFRPIGRTWANPFRGVLDGGYHYIKNLVITSEVDTIALIRYVNGGATVKNLIIDASCSISGGKYVAGIIGSTTGEGSGTVTVSNCGNMANITGTGVNVAGITGVDMSSDCTFIFNYCFNSGAISGGSESAAITGWGGNACQLNHCYNVGTVEGVDGTSTLARGTVSSNGVYDVLGQQGTSVNSEDVPTGRFAYILNGGKFGSNTVWRQNLDYDVDAVPVPFPTHGQVYPVDFVCDSTATDDSEFTNTFDSLAIPEHDFQEGVCIVCGTPTDDYIALNDSGYYEIGTPEQLNWFAHRVNKFGGVQNAILTDDIDFTQYSEDGVMIGSDSLYTGTFDGKHHTVTISYTSDLDHVALFSHVINARIANLNTSGTISSSNKYSAGIASCLNDSDIVENCISRVDITSSVDGDATDAGICAEIFTSVVRNCAYLGTLDAPTAIGNSGIVGWYNSGSIENCYMGGIMNVKPGDNSIIGRNNPPISNCAYLNSASGVNINEGITQVTTDDVISGALGYILNGKQSTDCGWFQNIDNDNDPDEEPVPDSSHGIIYAVGRLHCNGLPYEASSYSNTNSSTQDDHEYENGICTYCKGLEPDYITPDADGYYNVGDKYQLRWFIRYVNEENKPNSNIKLTADIDFSEITRSDSLMLGTLTMAYTGIFDGQGHVITVDYDTHHDYTALIANLGETKILNLAVDGKIKTNRKYAGGIASYARSNFILENCLSAVKINPTISGDCTAGGLVATANGFSTIRNCAFTGEIVSDSANCAGGLVGWLDGGSRIHLFENCFMVGTVSVLETDNNTIARNIGQAVLTDCYYIDQGPYVPGPDDASDFTSEQVLNGTMCYLLNNKVSGGTPWKQNIGIDTIPYPGGNHNAVYASGAIDCTDDITYLTFSNTDDGTGTMAHQYDENGVCQVCGARKISNGTQLKQLADDIASGAASQDVNVILDADIDMSGIEGYKGIGTTTYPFTGTFDGQGHVISHMVINDESTEGQAGLISTATKGAVVKNVTVDSTCSVTATQYAAGIIGATTSPVGLVKIYNCGNEADVTVSGANAGGIVGVALGNNSLLEMVNCYNSGDITGAKESAAICGWLGVGAHITNCYNCGNVTGADNDNTTFARYSTSYFRNCYNVLNAQVEEMSESQVESGELCYNLNNGLVEGAYLQTLGSDMHPVLLASHMQVIKSDTTYVNGDPVKVENINAGDGTLKLNSERYYSVDGVRLPALRKGQINIIIDRNGKVTKKYIPE